MVYNSGLKSQNEDQKVQGYIRLVDLRHSYPFVKWAGGKNQLLPELDSLIPSKFNRYFEPFLGGGAMFFHLVSDKNMTFTAYLSDTNEELIKTYKVVKESVEELIEALTKHQKGYDKNPSEYYYRLRDLIQPKNDVEIAARFIALNKTCYNGLYRVNKNGKFNVPMGRYKNPLICDSGNLRNVSSVLRYSKAEIQCVDYRKMLLKADTDDFVYMDPPYDPVSSTSNFTAYTHQGFGDEDQLNLKKTFLELNHKECKVLLSNSDTPFMRELYSDFSSRFKEVKVSRAINCKASKRVGHRELLIYNYS